MWLLVNEETIHTDPQYSCDFWIYQYEISYDLDKRCYSRQTSDVSIDTMNEESLPNETNHGTMITSLPTEIISKVLSYVTAVDLLAMRDVCRLWRAIVLEDKSLWNHISFSATEIDVKTTISLLREMPLLRTVELCNVHSSEDMGRLITALCEACWDLRQIAFPDNCDWHPTSVDLHQLSYYHPCIQSLHIATKQKLTPSEISNIGIVLADFRYLTDLKLVGFYWHQAELLPDILGKVHLENLSLPSLPGLTNSQFRQLFEYQPQLKEITLNTSALNGAAWKSRTTVKWSGIRAIENSALTADKLHLLGTLPRLIHLDINLSNSKKEEVLVFFKVPRLNVTYLKVSNCEYSDELLGCISTSLANLKTLVWVNPKDVNGEITDEGILAITRFAKLKNLQLKSRSISKVYYSNLASLKSLKYARINGMRIPGCL